MDARGFQTTAFGSVLSLALSTCRRGSDVLSQWKSVAVGWKQKKPSLMPDDAIRPKVKFVKKGDGISTPNNEWGYFHELAPEDGFVVDTGMVTGFISEDDIQAARDTYRHPIPRVVFAFVPEDVPEREEDTELHEWLDSRWYTCGCKKAGYAQREYPAWKYAEWERSNSNGRTSPVDWPNGWSNGKCKRCMTLIRVVVAKPEKER